MGKNQISPNQSSRAVRAPPEAARRVVGPLAPASTPIIPMNSPRSSAEQVALALVVLHSSRGQMAKTPLSPSQANGGWRIAFVSVVHDLWPVSRWRPPRPSPYGVGIGLSWKPNAAAFRLSDLS